MGEKGDIKFGMYVGALSIYKIAELHTTESSGNVKIFSEQQVSGRKTSC